MTAADRHEELRVHLRSRTPVPGTGYWATIDDRLRTVAEDQGYGTTADAKVDALSTKRSAAAFAEHAPPSAEPGTSGASGAGTDIGANETGSTGLAPAVEEPWWRNRQILAIAGAVLLAIVIIFALTNGSSDGPLGAITTDGTAEGATNDSAALADGPAGVDPPLGALQARLSGQVPAGVGQDDAASAGPYCATSNDAFVFTAEEIADRRAIVWFDIAFDGLVNFYAMQGDVIVINGGGYPAETGVLQAQPVAVAGSTATLPSYTMIISDTTVQFGPSNAALDVVSCGAVQDRVDQLFSLLEEPAFVDNGVAWPPADALLSSAGLGSLRIGMTVAELSTQLGVELEIQTADIAGAGACGWIADSSAISNTVFTIVEMTSAFDGIVRRVTVSDPRWSTPSGASVGMSEQAVLDLFPGQIVSAPHEFVVGNYLTYQPADTNDPNTVLFVSEGGTITQMHAGDRSWVGLVEGCL